MAESDKETWAQIWSKKLYFFLKLENNLDPLIFTFNWKLSPQRPCCFPSSHVSKCINKDSLIKLTDFRWFLGHLCQAECNYETFTLVLCIWQYNSNHKIIHPTSATCYQSHFNSCQQCLISKCNIPKAPFNCVILISWKLAFFFWQIPLRGP
jgi:hypothetical protein